MFGAFFSRAYSENDYLWGRLHGADRLIDIVLSALPPGQHLAPGMAATYKRQAFHAILDEEEERLTLASDLITSLRTEIGRSEEHTSELQSLMSLSYAVFCLKKKTAPTQTIVIILHNNRKT